MEKQKEFMRQISDESRAQTSHITFSRKPLVLLLRTARENDPYEATCEAVGFEARCLPLFDYEFIGERALIDTLSRSDSFSGLVLTSPRALTAIQRNAEAEAMLREDWVGKAVFTVGPKTAARARRLGLEVRGEEAGTSAELASYIVQQKPKQPLLFLTGKPHRSELPDILTAHNIEVDELNVYRAKSRRNFGTYRGRVPDWVVFFSPRGFELATENLELPWANVKKATIGPTTAAAIRAQGWEVDAVAEAPTAEGVALALSQ